MTNQNQQPQTVSELFPSKWLKAVDLPKPVTVTIEAVGFDQVYDKREGGYVEKLIVSFERCVRRLIANKTQAQAIWHITQSELFRDWVGQAVTLGPGQAHNGKPTIVISAPNEATLTPALAAAEDDLEAQYPEIFEDQSETE